jgi:transposase InsO family protein
MMPPDPDADMCRDAQSTSQSTDKCMAEGWLYVAAGVDLFSQRVVGWSMRAEMTAQLVADA